MAPATCMFDISVLWFRPFNTQMLFLNSVAFVYVVITGLVELFKRANGWTPYQLLVWRRLFMTLMMDTIPQK